MAASAPDRRVTAAHQKRDLLIALGVGAAVLALVILAVVSLSRQSAAGGGVEGTIVAKHFVAEPETQITVGRGGVSSRWKAGEYFFEVRVSAEHDKLYQVTVDPVVYASHEVGGRYYFVRAPATPPAS